MRMVKQGAAKIEGEKVADAKFAPEAGTYVFGLVNVSLLVLRLSNRN